VLDLVCNESASLANLTGYDFWHATLGYLLKININWKLYGDRYQILDCPSTFTYNLWALSKSKDKVTKLSKSKSIEICELIYTDITEPLQMIHMLVLINFQPSLIIFSISLKYSF
jgi:hypothetical protein